MPGLWNRAILHVDMDAFYAAIEQLDNPALRGKPVIVAGAAESRGVVSAASYEVRPYGVRSAMPTSQALRLCPHAIRVDPRMERYAEISDRVFEVFAEVTTLVEGASLDEAFLDVTGSQRLLGKPATIARRIKDEKAGSRAPPADNAADGAASWLTNSIQRSSVDSPTIGPTWAASSRRFPVRGARHGQTGTWAAPLHRPNTDTTAPRRHTPPGAGR